MALDFSLHDCPLGLGISPGSAITVMLLLWLVWKKPTRCDTGLFCSWLLLNEKKILDHLRHKTIVITKKDIVLYWSFPDLLRFSSASAQARSLLSLRHPSPRVWPCTHGKFNVVNRKHETQINILTITEQKSFFPNYHLISAVWRNVPPHIIVDMSNVTADQKN